MLELDIKPNILDRSRKLLLNSDFIEFDDTNWDTDTVARFNKGEVEAIRFGIKFLKGYMFTIGRTFCIDIQGSYGRNIKIRMTSFYGIGKQALDEKYCQIINSFMDTHHNDIVNRAIKVLNSEGKFELLETAFEKEGIVIKGKRISWENVGTKAYRTYYALFSKNDPKVYKSYNYMDDWNAILVYTLSRRILSEKGLSE
ncbi:hypothetical protein DBR11_27095 [Pedobacter sp. HMWF019]|uniref:hypothetical protein n=1 Tax=Pedobacter sp. HMWF019 TaxID=2056856 RepID=UPI000D376348|nr:hypothetical protein [Pedobacter sp. HMWF019]PTS92365.1 hypothetical protein DBR11_27095 [Pedobacter sp. HMWF019]